MEGADLEFGPQCRLRLGPRLQDRHLAQIVGERLGRPGDVAVDLGADLVLGERRVVPQVGDRPVPGPTHGVDAGVDHQAGCAPGLVAQHAEPLVRSLVHAHLLAQGLAVERPALAISADVALATELRLALGLGRQGHLERVSWRRFVQGQGGQRIKRPRRQVISVDQIDAGAAAAGGVEGRHLRRHRPDGESGPRQTAEPVGGLAIEGLGDPGGPIEQRLGRRHVEPRIGAQEGEEGGKIAAELHLGHHRRHPLANTGDFGEANGVDLVGT